jgi:hypothetical protein
MSALAVVLFGLFVIACVGCAIFWCLGMYHFIAMTSHKTQEAKGKWWSSGFMTVYVPSALTDAGRLHRQRAFLYFAGFLICWAIWFALFLVIKS